MFEETSNFPNQIDDRIFFSDIRADNKYYYDKYKELIQLNYYQEAQQILKGNNILYFGSWMMNQLEDRISNMEDYITNEEDVDPGTYRKNIMLEEIYDNKVWISDIDSEIENPEGKIYDSNGNLIATFTQEDVDDRGSQQSIIDYLDIAYMNPYKAELRNFEQVDNFLFYNAGSLVEIEINSGITNIGNYAFGLCTNLETIEIPNGVTTIGNGAFENCHALTNITIPNGVTSIGNYTFNDCISLGSVTIPNSVTSLGQYSFDSCIELTDIFMDGVWYVGDSIGDLDTYVNTLDSSANITYFDVTYKNKYWTKPTPGIYDSDSNLLADLTNYDFDREETDGNTVAELCGVDADDVYNVILPNGIRKIPNFAFRQTNISSIVIPEGVTSIGRTAFLACTSLQNVILPNTLITMNMSVFLSCDSLENIVIPNNVRYMDNYIFSGCQNLSNVTLSSNLTHLGEGAFEGNVNVPHSLKSIVIPHGVTEINENTFWHCNGLENVVLPNNLTIIKEKAFWFCTSLDNVVFPDTLTTIEKCAFYNCTNLTNISFPSSVTTIGEKSFEYCTSLTNITFSEGLKKIESEAFYNCLGPEELIIPNSVISIAPKAFHQMLNLERVIMDGTWYVGDYEGDKAELIDVTNPRYNVTLLILPPYNFKYFTKETYPS